MSLNEWNKETMTLFGNALLYVQPKETVECLELYKKLIKTFSYQYSKTTTM